MLKMCVFARVLQMRAGAGLGSKFSILPQTAPRSAPVFRTKSVSKLLAFLFQICHKLAFESASWRYNLRR